MFELSAESRQGVALRGFRDLAQQSSPICWTSFRGTAAIEQPIGEDLRQALSKSTAVHPRNFPDSQGV
jgi:hypothetical protein